jgi:hypothetical protein
MATGSPRIYDAGRRRWHSPLSRNLFWKDGG